MANDSTICNFCFSGHGKNQFDKCLECGRTDEENYSRCPWCEREIEAGLLPGTCCSHECATAIIEDKSIPLENEYA